MATKPSIGGPGLGLWEGCTDCRVISTNAVTKGDIVVFDGTVDTTTLQFDTVDQPATADINEGGLFGVALEDIAAGAEGNIRVRGVVDALMTGVVAVGARLAATNSSDVLTAITQDQKVIAIAQEAVSTAVGQVLFNGIEGFGHQSAA